MVTYNPICAVLVFSIIFISVHGKIRQKDETNHEDATKNPYISGRCAIGELKSKKQLPNPSISARRWLQTPSIKEPVTGQYQALGRILYADYLKEQLRTQKRLNFDTARETINFVNQLDILADIFYIEGVVELSGIKAVNIFARKIISSPNSKIILSTPNWIQNYANPITPGTVDTPGSDGEPGKNGLAGPQVEIYCDILQGRFTVQSKGADGHKGQNGGPGARGINGQDGRSRSQSDCTRDRCRQYLKKRAIIRYLTMSGDRGRDGTPGTNGGKAGNPGKGGDAGHMNVWYNKYSGQVTLMSCAGAGAQPAVNGPGGRRGNGGRGGTGVQCKYKSRSCPPIGPSCTTCNFVKKTGRASSGTPGRNGNPGSTPNTKGSDGLVDTTFVSSAKMDKAIRGKFPTELLFTIKRQAVDVLLGDSNDADGMDALKFIRKVSPKRTLLRREVKRKIRFLKSGHDILGYNTLFSPRTPWEELITAVQYYKDTAKSYEKAFNDIVSTAEQSTTLTQVTGKLSQLSTRTLRGERKRLQEAKRVSTAERGARLRAIRALEIRMDGITRYIQTKLPEIYKKAKFHSGDYMAILQGLVGFVSGAATKDPLSSFGAIVSIAASQDGKKCLQTIRSYVANIKKWLTFGKKFKLRVDPSDLDFHKLDIKELPEMMKVDLEVNKETLAGEFVCLLDVASRTQDVAKFKAEIESFFIVGAYRIDLIARLLELDNEIGGQKYDIKVLKDTEKAITDLGRKPADTPITKTLRKTFTDKLLRAYSELEEMFLRKLSKLLKALEFHTLWKANNPLSSFRRTATESAYGTGRLNGDVQLTGVFSNALNYFLKKGSDCLLDVKSTHAVWKYSFSNSRNKKMFDKLASDGQTSFFINIKKSCRTCYNARLLKIYIELSGPKNQPATVPRFVKYKFRHHTWSYFRAGDGSIKEYRQKEKIYKNGRFVNVYESHSFNRFITSDAAKCAANGHTGVYCGVENGNDNRLKSLCDDPTTRLASKTRRLHIKAECKSPFGYYDLRIPVDRNLECNDTTNDNNNCKDLDLKKFTNMNIWAYVLYWDDQYPSSPDDPMCNRGKKKDQASLSS